VDRATSNEAFRTLRSRAQAELEQLQQQQQTLERLIEFVDEYTSTKSRPAPKPRRRRRRRPTSLIEVIRERPGIRTSMLAMVVDRPSEEIAGELVGHEQEGTICRDGLGWRIA
jgi:hypothetical protein